MSEVYNEYEYYKADAMTLSIAQLMTSFDIDICAVHPITLGTYYAINAIEDPSVSNGDYLTQHSLYMFIDGVYERETDRGFRINVLTGISYYGSDMGVAGDAAPLRECLNAASEALERKFNRMLWEHSIDRAYTRWEPRLQELGIDSQKTRLDIALGMNPADINLPQQLLVELLGIYVEYSKIE